MTVSGDPAPEVAVTNSPAPGPEDAEGSDWPDAPVVESGSQEGAPSAAAAAASASASRPRADPGAAARMFDAATTRRRSVVFEEDDELDVPDFLK